MVEGDVFDICKRLEEVDPALYIIQLEGDKRCEYAIMEHCADNVDRFVYKTPELDPRIIKKCEYMRAVPLEARLPAIEKELDDREDALKNDQMDELYENMGGPMLRQLRHDGFTDGNFTDYAKVNRR